MYTAIVLDKQSCQLLTWATKALVPNWTNFKFETQHQDPLPHHMTINLGEIDESLNPRTILCQPAEILGKSLYVGTDVLVFRVSKPRWYDGLVWHKLKTMNDKGSAPHITCALTAGNKPMISNFLFNGTQEPLEKIRLEDPLFLSGIIRQCGG